MSRPILIILIMAFLLILPIIFGKDFLSLLPKEEFSQIQSQMENLQKETVKNDSYQDFVSNDKNLILKYPSDWTIINEVLDPTPKGIEWIYEFEYLLSVQNIENGKFIQLMVSKMVMDNSTTFEQIVEEMKKTLVQQKWIMELVKTEENENIMTFEAIYDTGEKTLSLHSKEKIIFLESIDNKKTAYLIAVLALEKDWSQLSQEVNIILGSAQLKR
ncbi:MAG: hypothetical protein Q7T34_00590 [Candidatus Parcubacteria bacterium]|nr:hypothetical protein [Candidatus Parcubacteria bacterium]